VRLIYLLNINGLLANDWKTSFLFSPSLKKKEKHEDSFPCYVDSENIDSNLAHLNSTDCKDTKPIWSQSVEQPTLISAPVMTKGKKRHRRRGSNEKCI